VKGAEIHAMDDHEVVVKLKDAREEEFSLRFKHATGELENTARLAETRRDIARLMTIARQRGIDLEAELRR
jgi:large subunit ribosomal protein L29